MLTADACKTCMIRTRLWMELIYIKMLEHCMHILCLGNSVLTGPNQETYTKQFVESLVVSPLSLHELEAKDALQLYQFYMEQVKVWSRMELSSS